MRARAIVAGVLVAAVVAAVVVLAGGEDDDRAAVDATAAMDRACAARAPAVDGPFGAAPDGPREVEAIVRGAAADVRALDLGREGRADLVLEALTGYADAARIVASADAIVDPLPLVEGVARARRRLDRVAAELRVPGCSASALAPRRAEVPQ